MFMIEKALIVIIAMYAIGFMLLVAQFVYADTFGLTLVSWTNQPIKSALIGNGTTGILQVGSLNTLQQNVTSNTRSATVTNPIGTAAGMAWEIMLLMTGTYIFNILYLLLGGGDGAHNSVAAIIVTPFVVIYVILLMRAIVGYIRGI